MTENKQYDETIDVTEINSNTPPEQTVEYVYIEEAETINIDFDDAFPALGETNDELKHSLMTDRESPDQHPITSITGLKQALTSLSSLNERHDIYAESGGLAEFRKWKDGNPSWESRIGYFVSVVDGDGNIDICNQTDNDAYGVTVSQSAFCGYQDTTYDLLNLDKNSINKENFAEYDKVCLVGNVKVRIQADSGIVAGDYVFPDNYGHASKSENQIGFKVLSVGTDPIIGHYASIALVPQNDNIGRVMNELGYANEHLGDITIQLGEIKDDMAQIESEADNAIKVAEDAKGMTDILDEAVSNLKTQVSSVADVANKAKESAQKAEIAAESLRTEAISSANKALADANSALTSVNQLQNDMTPLATWKDANTGEHGIAGFVSQADRNSTELSTLVTAVYGNGSDVIGVIQKIDNNGATIQHLVTHADTYSIGPYSLSYGLSYDEAIGILQANHIYIPTYSHTETSDMYVCTINAAVSKNARCSFIIGEAKYGFVAPRDLVNGDLLKYNLTTNELLIDDEAVSTYDIQDVTEINNLTFSAEYAFAFESGKVYKWTLGSDVYSWQEDSSIALSLDSACPNGTTIGDLWYCRNGISEDNKIVYYPETLYRWDGAQWISVATIDGNIQARSLGLLKQTANELTSTYTNIRGDVSVIKQDVNTISTTVSNVDGKISAIEQSADAIMAGTFSSEGASSLALLLNGMQSVTKSTEHVLAQSFTSDTIIDSYDGNKYSQPPSWDGEKFVFDDGYLDNDDGIYYFHSDDTSRYCKVVDDGYEIYTIGNVALASLSSRVADTESELESWTRFQAGASETMTYMSQTSDGDGAEIASLVFGEYRQCVSISTELTDEDISNLQVDRYTNPPEWAENSDGEKAFIFNEADKSDDGIYCMPANGDGSYYYKLLLDDDKNIIGYEQYKMKASNYASIMQKVDENGSSIGLAAGNDDTIGSLFVNAINDKSEVLINADRIGINGTAIFRDNLNDGTTTISGSYIRTGIIQSNNYVAPLDGEIFAQAGTLFNLNDGTLNSVNFDLDNDGNVSITGRITATSGYIGNEINGFTIESRKKYKFVVPVETWPAYEYYGFQVGDSDYCFSLDTDLQLGDEIVLNVDDSTVTVTGSQNLVIPVTSRDSSHSYILFTKYEDISFYYLSNNQLSLNPNDGTRGTAGVYIASDGIGLGHGNFYVDSNGHLNTYGNITMYTQITDDDGIAQDVAAVQLKDGNLDLRGNITLGGNITFASDGHITWSTANSPVLVLYAPDPLSVDDIDYESAPEVSVDEWHTILQDEDMFAIYSYDGGETWTRAIRIGDVNGDDDIVTYDGIKEALLRADNAALTIITKDSIDTVDIYANNIYGGNIYAGDGIGWYTQMVGTGLNIYDADGYQKIGIGYTNAESEDEYPFITIGAGTTSIDEEENSNTQGMILKLRKGLWIGDASIKINGGDWPIGIDPSVNTTLGNDYMSTGIFFDFDQHVVYKYENGNISELGSGVAVFG